MLLFQVISLLPKEIFPETEHLIIASNAYDQADYARRIY